MKDRSKKFSNMLEQFKSKIAMLIFLDILFLFLPGVLAIFLYKNDLFISLDWVKLALLSASIIAPFVFINTIFISIFEKAENPTVGEKDDDLFFSLSLSIIITGFAFYLLFPTYYFLEPSSIWEMLIFVIVIEVVVGMRAWWVERSSKNKE